MGFNSGFKGLMPSSFAFEDLRQPLGSMRLPRSLNMRADMLKVEEKCEVPFRCLVKWCFSELKKTLNLSRTDNVYFLFWLFCKALLPGYFSSVQFSRTDVMNSTGPEITGQQERFIKLSNFLNILIEEIK